jgi:hypothetical protein
MSERGLTITNSWYTAETVYKATYLCNLPLVGRSVPVQCKGHVAVIPYLVRQTQARSQRYL